MAFLPKTPIGKWSIFLFIICILLNIVASIVSSIQEPVVIETFYRRMTVNISAITGLVAMAGAFILGIVSITRSKERSFLVFLVSFLGFLALIFLIGELIF
ncbi:hypothetical protein [Bacillus sp. REN3]|uniref:hypothetical protein n=1 Tax=Bacillus sp. REN3 TaxID=2802440 RepID=UPI001AED3816|nr:hypothetical protein [Bacillus sp. REN3]